MEMLPIVVFLILSTGLCTVALLGLSISDMFNERHKARAVKTQHRIRTAAMTQSASHAKPQPQSKPLREQLLRAA